MKKNNVKIIFMRLLSLLKGAANILTFPFRQIKKINVKVIFIRLLSPLKRVANVITSPFRRIYYFFIADHEEKPKTDFYSATNPLWDELENLRRNILRLIITLLLFSVIAFYYSPSIFEFIQRPLTNITKDGLGVSSPEEMLDLIPRVSIAVGFLLAIPLIMFEVFLYVAPKLKPKDRIPLLLSLLVVLLFLSVGILVDYYYIVPVTISNTYLLSNHYGTYDWGLASYISFVLKVYFATEIALFIPFAIPYSMRFGAIESAILKSPRVVFLIMFFIASTITPGTSIIFDFGFSLFMFFIYLFSTAFINLIFPKRISR